MQWMKVGAVIGDHRGGMMVWGGLTAIFLCGAVFYVHGIATAIEHRERMQDAADAAALGSAVMHARGMNLVVLTNLLMAALLAILVTFKLMQSVAVAGAMLAAGMSFGMPGAIAAVVPLKNLAMVMERSYRAAEPVVNGSMAALRVTARALGTAIPVASEVRAFDGARRFSPPATGGLVVPPRLTLPIEDGEYKRVCDEAGKLATGLLFKPLELALGSIGGGVITDRIVDMASSMTEQAASWLCEPGGKPPSKRVTIDVALPELPAIRACLEASEAEAKPLCEEAEAVRAAAEPHPETGDCQQRCGPGGPYAQRTALAAVECQPLQLPLKARDRLRAFSWQERTLQARYVYRGGSWQLSSMQRVEGPVRRSDDSHPCTRSGFMRGLGITGDAVCERFDPALPPRGRAAEGTRREVTVTQVMRMLGCSRRVEHDIVLQDRGDNFGGGSSAAGGRGGGSAAGRGRGGSQSKRGDKGLRVPQKLAKEVEHGDDSFQLRGFAFGKGGEDTAGRILAVGATGNEKGKQSDPMAGIAVAQAEYFFSEQSGKPSRDLMLWQMRWRGRLRRLRIPEQSGGDSGGISAACSKAATGDCGSVDRLLRLSSELITH